MLTILDFQITRAAQENFHLDVCERGQLQLPTKWFFAAPPILWMMALYFCLKVLKTEGMEVRLKAPNEIRDRLRWLVRGKQHDLDLAFWLLLAGLVSAVLLLIWRRLI